MFASRFASARSGTFGSAPRAVCASSYGDLELESSVLNADPHRLIEMLYDGAATRLAQARTALREGRTSAKGEATGRTLRILEEGLKASLDARGGELAGNLRMLYEYMSQRLLRANAANSEDGYAEVAELLEGLRQAWKEIGPQVRGQLLQAGALPPSGSGAVRTGVPA